MDYAQAPSRPDSRSALRQILINVLIGAGAAAALLVVIFLLNQRVEKPEELEENYAVPLLSAIRRYRGKASNTDRFLLSDKSEMDQIESYADDIREMPMGMHTILQEGGGSISGGQRQRLMIARAVAPKPRILIFDEATSALDNITQKKVSEALDKMNCTRIVIAHRLNTIRHCDRIVVLDGGKIAESGTYEELLAQKGLFAELVERQRVNEQD